MATLLTSQTPAAIGNDGSPGITIGTSEIFTEAGSITGVRFWSDGGAGTYTVCGWRVTNNDDGAGGAGAELFSPIAFVGTPAAGWNEVAVSPIAITPDTVMYRAGVHHPTDYALTNGFFTTGGPGESGLTNGAITAPADNTNPVGLGTLRQGTFTIDAAPSYPRQVGASALYFVEFLFEPESAGQEITPGGVNLPIALGAPTLALSQSLAAGALAVPIALGGPALSQSQSLSAGGLAVPIALGGPTLTQSQTLEAGGLALPIALGAVTFDQTVEPSFEITPGGLAIPIALGSIELSQTTRPTGGWETLRGIVREARADHAREQQRLANPIDCPKHQWPLDRGPGGELHCLFGGHTV